MALANASLPESLPPGEAERPPSLELMPLPQLVPILLTIPLVVALAVVGNLLVLVSYALDSHLRTVSNLYLFHLAACDLMLASVSMPIYLLYTCLQLVWPFGKVLCKVRLVDFPRFSGY